ncbi:MAG: hypothetical protein ACYTGG_05035 [Planctomycetota bacterium]
MHYLFRGLRRGIGEPVIGRILALNEDAVHKVLEAHAIIVDTLSPEEAGGLFPPTLEEALDEAGLRITFNQMARVHEGNGVWILVQDRIRGRVMQLAREALGGDEARQPARRRIEQVLETLYGEKRPGTAAAGAVEGRFANADEVRAEVRRLMAAINKLERELISMRSRRPADRAPRRAVAKGAPRDRTRDDLLREIFQHNLELMKLTSGQGITAPAG